MGAEVAMIALGASGLASGLLSSQAAKSNNAASLGFSKWSQLQAQEYNRQMYEKQLYDQKKMYEQYQSPQAIAQQLAQAGLNPSAMSGSIGSPSMPSVPSGGSSSSVSAPHLENEGLALGQGIESIAKAASSFAGANAQDAQAKETRTLLQDKLNQLVLQNNGQELYNAKQDWDNYIAQKFGESEAGAKLNDLTADAYVKYSQGDNLGALSNLHFIQSLIASEELGIKKEERANIGMMLLKQLSLLDSQINLNNELAATEPSKRSANYGSAALDRANADTINAIRQDVVRYQKAIANIKDTEDFVSNNTAWNNVQMSLWELRQAQLIPEQIEAAIERAKKDNNWYEVKVLLGMIDTGVKAYGAYKGAKTGQGYVNAQDVRNKIDGDFKNWQMQQGNKKPIKIFDSDTGEPYTIWR